MSDFYRLNEDKTISPCSLDEWANRFYSERQKERQIRRTVTDNYTVSTIFLGLNHNFATTGDPIVFETMIFGGPCDQYQTRCSTYAQALEMHRRALRTARRAQRKLDTSTSLLKSSTSLLKF